MSNHWNIYYNANCTHNRVVKSCGTVLTLLWHFWWHCLISSINDLFIRFSLSIFSFTNYILMKEEKFREKKIHQQKKCLRAAKYACVCMGFGRDWSLRSLKQNWTKTSCWKLFFIQFTNAFSFYDWELNIFF